MNVACPHCTQALEIADEWAGHAVDCPSCQQALTVPLSPVIPRPKVAATPSARSYSHPSKPPRRGGGGFGKLPLLVIILAGAGFGYLMVRFKESPQRVWKRVVEAVKGFAEPTEPMARSAYAPAPTAERETASAPTPTPAEASPTVLTPFVAEEPVTKPVDPIAWLLEHKERAPEEVILQRPATLSILDKENKIGFVTLPARTRAQVVKFTLETVSVRVGSAAGQIPIDATNLRALAKAEQGKAVTPAGPPAIAPATAPQPAQVSRVAGFPTPHYASPGVILTRDDLETLKANIAAGKEPWKSGYDILAADGRAQLSYKMAGPFENISRAPNVNLNPWRSDMVAIWNLSRMWYFTGENAYAQKAHGILLAWATTHTSFTGRESMLDLGDYVAAFVGGADILRGTWPGWTASDTVTVKKYFKDVLMPASNPYGESQFGAANKGALALVSLGLMAIFNEDSARLEKVVYQVRTLAHIGLRSSNDIGMLGDSLRDQGHSHGQLVSLAMFAEALWKQGIDIYGDYDNRLLAAGEYFARVNERVPTPFLPFGTTDAYYLEDKTNHGWGGGNVALNLIYGAYVVRKGLEAPYISLRRPKMPADGSSFMFLKEADQSKAAPLALPEIPRATSITAGFRNVDIGGATPVGGASYSDGIWKVRGGGSEMWKANDSCHFAYKAITGNGVIVAKVESVENTSPSARAGVMMRTSLEEGSPRAWMAVSSGGNLEQNMPNLTVYGGTNYGNKTLAKSLSSYWVKLERIGNMITGYVSPDGTNWAATDVGRIDAPVPDTIYAGLVVCSADQGSLNVSTFRNVQITEGDGDAPIEAPPAPAAVLAAPGDGAVPLRWQASFGAASYTVKRGTARGGPYSAIASGITATSYTDKAAINGTTYYYVITASNAAGTSGDSPEDTATPGRPPMNVAIGGTARANEKGTGAEQAFDKNVKTRWFNEDLGPTGWIRYDFGSGVTRTITSYSVASAMDVPGRDPKDWQFQGSNDDGSTWTTLDTQSNQSFEDRCQTKIFKIARPGAYRSYRLNITSNNGAKGTHVAEIGLFADQNERK